MVNLLQKKYFVELLGAFILSLGINMTQGSTIIGVAVPLFSAILIGRNVSGGHYNSAITLGFTLDNILHHQKPIKTEILEFFIYYIYQCAGAFLSCVTSYLCYDNKIVSFYDADEFPVAILIAECIGTYLFVYCILIHTEDRYTQNKVVSTFVIILSIVISTQSIGVSGLTKGVVNPALTTAHSISNGDFKLNNLCYFLGQFMGGALAGILYKFLFRSQVDKIDEDEKPKKKFGLLNEDSGELTITQSQSQFN